MQWERPFRWQTEFRCHDFMILECWMQWSLFPYFEWTISQIDISISRKFQSTIIWCDVFGFFFVCFIGACSNYRIEKQFLYMFKLNFILCLRWKTLILWAARRFWNSDMWTMAKEYIRIAYTHPLTPGHSASNTGNGGFTIYFTLFHFIWFSNGIEVPVTVESMWAISLCNMSMSTQRTAPAYSLYVCTIRMWNAFHVLVKCVFVWSFLFNFETIKA